MGLLVGLVGGAVGAEVATVVNGFIQKQGGVRGILAQFEKQGLGPTMKSWISTGENQPITADQMHRALGYEKLQELGAKPDCPRTKWRPSCRSTFRKQSTS